MNSTCKRESQVQINTWFDYATHCYAVFANFLACNLFSCCPMSQKQITFPITQLLCPDKDSSCLDCVHRRHSLSQWSTKFFFNVTPVVSFKHQRHSQFLLYVNNSVCLRVPVTLLFCAKPNLPCLPTLNNALVTTNKCKENRWNMFPLNFLQNQHGYNVGTWSASLVTFGTFKSSSEIFYVLFVYIWVELPSMS